MHGTYLICSGWSKGDQETTSGCRDRGWSSCETCTQEKGYR